ncbi:NACHT domain-containing protein [Lacrimispora sp.]|uniref:NACHT domain-containing protein n=1 Tax=Lacrimispora sp. TaxID=2719234 RepID=UPI0032E40FD6
MNWIMQANSLLLLDTESGVTYVERFRLVIDNISDFSDTIQNMLWFIVSVITAIMLIFAFFSIREKANKYTRMQIEHLVRNGKYIRGIFVELNGSKEVLRYFVYNKKWKKRLINSFNFVYKNAYGDILRAACVEPSVSFQLGRTASLERIENVVGEALKLHTRFRERGVELKPDFEESKYLFEIVSYPYTESLGSLQQYVKAANRKYMIITGSAGNGKTNLLCSISELLINLKEVVIFLNARDIEGDATKFLCKELKLPEIYIKHMEKYFWLVNILLTIQGKHLFIIIDAINENDSKQFGEQIATLINELSRYNRVRIIVSCRNEYYKERFRGVLVDAVNIPAFEFDLKEQSYTPNAIERIIKAYSKHFNYNGNISASVQNVLSEQLLLLRIFFEVNKNSDADAHSIRKHEIFAQYINMAKKNSGETLENLLDTLADAMLEKYNFDDISLSDLEACGINNNMILESVDNSILISKKLISHEGTIARNETEVVYFVFDEMRDYYLARRLLLNNISTSNVDWERIIEKIRELNEIGASCAEGIIHYTYVFFKTDVVVAESGKSEKLCNEILDIYRIIEKQDNQLYWNRSQREEFENLGMRIVMTSGFPLTAIEISYIQDCLMKNPNEDGGMLFDAMLEGTLYGGVNDLDTYLNILLGMKDEKVIRNAFQVIIVNNYIDKGFRPEYFVLEHKCLINTEPDKALQIQKVAELFLFCFKFKDVRIQEELRGYFYNLPTHDGVRQEMMLRMKSACAIEEKAYE